MYEHQKLFEFIIERVKNTGDESGLRMPQAFGKWFTNMYFLKPVDVQVTDGSGDGKIDIFVKTDNGESCEYHVINTKYTEEYNKSAPVSFYDEITRFWRAFADKSNRGNYLKIVKPELRAKYSNLFKQYDDGKANLIFLTNCKRNEEQYRAVKNYKMKILHLDDLLEFVTEHIEGAMPRTSDMLLTGINSVLSPDTRDSEVPTSIVFARLVDFVKYMSRDPYDLLFARNVRLWLKNTPVNKEIENTFRESPKEFVFSNNGITMLCSAHKHEPGTKELIIENPRIVNGSQTLHSIRDVENPSINARVMLRIIQVPPSASEELPKSSQKRRDIINKISIRTNRQNPIKKWDLVSNDDFQNELARYFWHKKLYYERRQKEYSVRKSELRSAGIQRGSNIRELTQYISSYYFDKKALGPVTAKHKLGELFEENAYDRIRQTPVENVYQIYLFSKIIGKIFKMVSQKPKYMNYEGHINYALFSVIVMAFKLEDAKWGQHTFTKFLEGEEGNYFVANDNLWTRIIKNAANYIDEFYKIEKRQYKQKEGKELTVSNYFKSNIYVRKILESKIPIEITKPVSKLLKRIS